MTSVSSKDRCEQSELVSAYALNGVSSAEASQLESHIGRCNACRQQLDIVRTAIDAFAFWPTDVLRPSRPLWERLAQRIGAPNLSSAGMNKWTEPQWAAVAPGISCKVLATDQKTDRVSMLVRLAPGTDYPPHTHAGFEELHLLHGELIINDRKLYPGDYSRAEAGTADTRVWSETGCTCVLVTSARDILG
jgi:anti-sigma factor ChrR (cupin superfamily)